MRRALQHMLELQDTLRHVLVVNRIRGGRNLSADASHVSGFDGSRYQRRRRHALNRVPRLEFVRHTHPPLLVVRQGKGGPQRVETGSNGRERSGAACFVFDCLFLVQYRESEAFDRFALIVE